ncbi:MAG: acyl-CoA thioesterase [Treponema sp.]|jgi:acyl-CoA thioester hydrolase|nr:acyl-CoA thioesterase [Treponema sp.]
MMKLQDNNGPYNIWAETETTVEFYDLDPLQVVWHGNYFNYFEKGRRALLEKIKYDYREMEESGYAFPIIEISAKYLGSLRFKDCAIVKAVLLEYENRLKIQYEIRNTTTGQITTKGVSTQMALDIKAGESCFVCPQVLVDKVEAFIKEKEE